MYPLLLLLCVYPLLLLPLPQQDITALQQQEANVKPVCVGTLYMYHSVVSRDGADMPIRPNKCKSSELPSTDVLSCSDKQHALRVILY